MPPSKRYMEILEEMKDIYIRKNAGYSGDSEDPWINFRRAELFGVSAFKGCLIRMSDKFMRVANLSKNPDNEQVGESIKDSLEDLANYAVMAICVYEDELEKLEKEKEKTNAGNTGSTTNITTIRTRELVSPQKGDFENSHKYP